MENVLLEMEQNFDQRVSQLEPCDAGVWLGRPFYSRVFYPDAVSLKQALSEQGIKQALVASTMSQHVDSKLGNEELLLALKDLPKFYGIMTLLPDGTGEYELKQYFAC